MSTVTLSENDGILSSSVRRNSRSQTTSDSSMSLLPDCVTHTLFPSSSFRDTTTTTSSRSLPPHTDCASGELLMSNSLFTPTCSVSHWSCGLAVDVSEIERALEPLSLPSANRVTPSASELFLTSTSFVVAQEGNNGAPRIQFTASAVLRSQLLACVPLVLNLTVVGPRIAVWWSVANVTISGQGLNFTSSNINFLNWWVLHIQFPRSGWWVNPTTSRYVDTVIELQIAMSCDETSPVLIAVVEVLTPGVSRALDAHVKTLGQYTQVVSVVSSSGGFGIDRMLAIRSLALCNADSATGGGLIDFTLRIKITEQQLQCLHASRL
ncbi:Hypothetical protein, putative [Bodo saltans]|uniref:Uncharacterized protein n=1 Tax=Bodo saltans TaxID=75058 RepID=A0A0S4J2X8_BODSA|nr:Hypothetical protein, putative [Bodo saltans]|eukprot:CUG85546.1 Hypothetical protein, putative [Bodo saltans]